MSSTASKLLQKVKESLQLRSTDFTSYTSYFEHPKSFITATIAGQQEFVPISLLCQNSTRYSVLLDLYTVFGVPEPNPALDHRLNLFYEQHGLTAPDISHKELTYYVKPVPQKSLDPFFSIDTISKLSTYAGTPYKASDAFLKDLGQTYSKEIVDKTNQWAQAIHVPAGYTLELERYWQVAGRFKSFTWAKIYLEKYKDKKIFFSVGVDVAAQGLTIKLDGLRSGTHKLSNFEIRDFDYFTQNMELSVNFGIDEIERLNLSGLIFITNKFIEINQPIYEQVIDFIWNDKIDANQYTNRLFKLTNLYKSPADFIGKNLPIDADTVTNLVIDYEKFILTHADRASLAKDVSLINDKNIPIINSFEVDGKPRKILVEATTGGTQEGFEMSRSELEYLGDDLHTWMYHIVEYNPEVNSGKLIIRKGSPTKYADLKSINFEVTIKS